MKKTVWAVIRKNTKDGPRYLLAKRSSSVNNSGQWGFFGGTVDEGETLRAALARELREESGLRMTKCRLLFTVKLEDKQCSYYEVEVASPRVKINRESSKYKFLALDDALEKKLHKPAKIFLDRANRRANLQFRLRMINANLQQQVTAYEGSDIVGGAVITLPSGKLHNFHVTPKFRGKGYAADIMDYVMGLPNAPTKLTASASLGSPVKGKDLIKFYSRWGFKVVAGNEILARMEK